MTAPTTERFMALARSSPWRWASLRFSVSWTGPSQLWSEPLRSWVRRPDAVRVETTGGDLVYLDVRTVSWGRSRAILTGDGPQPVPTPRSPLDPDAPKPEFDDDGFVRHRPPDDGQVFYDDPMFRSYHWVAMLDPVELADGDGPMAPVELDRVIEVDHHDRPSWEATVRTTAGYVPRCSCCAAVRPGNPGGWSGGSTVARRRLPAPY